PNEFLPVEVYDVATIVREVQVRCVPREVGPTEPVNLRSKAVWAPAVLDVDVVPGIGASQKVREGVVKPRRVAGVLRQSVVVDAADEVVRERQLLRAVAVVRALYIARIL